MVTQSGIPLGSSSLNHCIGGAWAWDYTGRHDHYSVPNRHDVWSEAEGANFAFFKKLFAVIFVMSRG